MPQTPPLYVERLGVRARWWVVVIAIAVFGSAELFAGFDGRIIAIVTAVVVVPTVVLLALSGRTVLRVDHVGLHVGGATMTYDEMESVEALDAKQTKEQVGPAADPAAFLVFRGYIRESVLVRPLDPRPVPYWLVSTRAPQRIVAAVEGAARAAFSAR